MSDDAGVTLITGASAGIGEELARVFAHHGHRLVLIARRAERLAELAAAIKAQGHAEPLTLALDLSRRDAVDEIGRFLAARNLSPRYIVNNAGFGLLGPAVELSREEQLAMIDLNVRTLTDLSLVFSESLMRQRGGLLNVASVAGFLPGPGMAVYYATKAYVLSFTEALHREWKRRGVRVTALCPGPVETEFQARAGVNGQLGPDFLHVPAHEVAEAGYRALMRGDRIVVPGMLPRMITLLPRLLPRGLVLAVMHRRQKRRKAGRATSSS